MSLCVVSAHQSAGVLHSYGILPQENAQTAEALGALNIYYAVRSLQGFHLHRLPINSSAADRAVKATPHVVHERHPTLSAGWRS